MGRIERTPPGDLLVIQLLYKSSSSASDDPQVELVRLKNEESALQITSSCHFALSHPHFPTELS